MKLTIFGIGYVGLVQGAALAQAGHNVLCVDNNIKKIKNLQNGIIPIYEPGLSSLVTENQQNDRLHFSSNPEDGVHHSNLIFITVGTPLNAKGAADIRFVLEVASIIATHMTEYKIVVNKSTVPVGTADKVKNKISSILKKRNSSLPFDVASNPEFLKEGSAVNDFMRPDRIILGTNTEKVKNTLTELYLSFNRNHDRIIHMDIRSAELTKYVANCMLATKISFMNEMSNIAEIVGADIEKVRQGIGSDSRIGNDFIYAGCGYGGSCFPKDIQALKQSANDFGYNSKILSAVESVNISQKKKLFNLIICHFNSSIYNKVFAIWGLSFKPNTNDIREAPSIILIEQLLKAGAKIQAFDPQATDEAKQLFGNRKNLFFMDSKESAITCANALIIVTEWREFWSPDFDKIKQELTHPVIFDGRNLYNPEQMKKIGFNYYAIGRGQSVCHQNILDY
ncbi:UDP-glucose/GDP-mannose dehydrogenase family protein [uncultured Paraglaciecola sp.]|uniref:UDP-glucose dehydrogenase family protein n=1 Tax=uncultured Paraglaciecola sp. TaxID=1765024 RepID=UPI0025CC0F0B|nr:UDP-glucose/GDP-mannose dehydrogenase family protein [uncultured Paraglaciecola sp.]